MEKFLPIVLKINNKMLHIELTRKSDLIVVCPATANIIAKFANGYADDLASTSSNCFK